MTLYGIVLRVFQGITSLKDSGKHYFYLKYNYLLFKKNNIIFSKRLYVYNKVNLQISPLAIVNIGREFQLISQTDENVLSGGIVSSIKVEHDAVLKIGDYVGISNSSIWACKNITIGNHVMIGANCIITDSDLHSLDWEIRKKGGKTKEGYWIDGEAANKAPIIIGDNVLIGTRCIILKGVSIGEHSVIGAGSVVTRNIPANCIAAGNPCKIIKTFS